MDRRKTNRSFDFNPNQVSNWNNGGDWSSYKGPMVPWIRMCSNSAGHPLVGKPRFVFHGGKGFYQTYGFADNPNRARGSQLQIIGYTPTKPPILHSIENSLITREGKSTQYPIHVPTPEINKINVMVQKELYRRAEVEWTCFSWEQLTYMTPYFLIPGISIMLEWGWNHFRPDSLVDITDENLMYQLWRNAYPLYTNNVIKSRGNYDVLYGIVTNFNWSMEGSKIVCMTEITSKDRLYAGISKDMGLTVNDNSNPDAPRPIFQALRDFIGKDATLLNLKSIAESSPGSELRNIIDTPISGSSSSQRNGLQSQNLIWLDILRPIFSEPDPNVRGMKVPYIHGVFSGRPKKFYNDPNGLGKPYKNDFDKSTVDKVDASKVWINMGMIVEILNHFSGLDGGKGEPMFQVDITNAVIAGHPNLISCNRDVLIPNAIAPKFHYGSVGLINYGSDQTNPTPTEYEQQYVNPQTAETIADKILRKVCSQTRQKGSNTLNNVCYRNNLDKPINFLRYLYDSSPQRGLGGYLGHKNYLDSFAFPSLKDVKLPSSTNPSKISYPKGGVVEAMTSGLLSNIYLSYSAFQTTVMDPDSKTASYVDIYKKILSILNNSVDGFWDLTLVEVENIMTITDKNYLPTQSKLNQDVDPTYTFDYFDADSIIRSLKFRPTLSDAQTTRAIYGEVNNPTSKYVYVDKNDLLDYKFRDAIFYNKKDKRDGDPNSPVDKRTTAKDQIRDILGDAQKLATSENDDGIQMTINRGGFTTSRLGTSVVPQGPFEYLKFCLPSSVGKQLFRLLINDKDEVNNPRYCALQPGITLELTIQGCGGLRTFQYFLVKNLPEPYSHRNIIFRIQDVKHIVSQEGSGWDTIITAGILPLRKYISSRLAPPAGGWPPEVVNPTIPPS